MTRTTVGPLEVWSWCGNCRKYTTERTHVRELSKSLCDECLAAYRSDDIMLIIEPTYH